MAARKKISAIVSQWFARSHADVMVKKFLEGFPTDEGFYRPRVDLVSMYLDQITDHDVGVTIAAEHGLTIYPSIVDALTLGGDKLAVDGVLLIGEHGDYAWNEKEQHLYPRKYFMEQICGVMAGSGRGVPVFNDKHLSYNWHDAKWMVDRAAALGAPLMAGSSIPLAWRDPWVEYELDTPIEQAIAIGFSGLDIYGFHTLEALQCMVERRIGGETGVAAVTCLEGDDVWRAGEQGLWSKQLAHAACAAVEDKPEGTMQENCPDPAVFLVEYRDGLRAAVLMLNGFVRQNAFAAQANGQVQAAEFHAQGHGGEDGHYAHFSYLSLNVEEMFLTGRPNWPVERTLLTSGILEAALTSRFEGHRRLETPWLDVTYRSYEASPWRPTGPRPTGPCLS